MACTSTAVVSTNRAPLTLATMDVGTKTSAVTVKVLRKWKVFPKWGGGRPSSLELVFVDSEGTTIQCHVDRKHIYIHDPHLHEGHVYQITKFVVVSNVGPFRATRHNYMMVIEKNSIVRPAARKDSIPDPEWVFTPPADCFDRSFNMDYLVAISGILTKIDKEYPFTRPSGTSSRMNIDLDNRGYRFSVTLFGEHVEAIKEFMKAGDSSNTVIVLLWAKVEDYNGRMGIQTTMGSTRMLINPTLPEADALKETLSDAIMSPTLTITQGSTSSDASSDFLLIDQKHSLAQVIEEVDGTNFVVLATITAVSQDKPWWYDACKCHRKAEPDSGMWYCERCNIHVASITKKYVLKLSIEDATDSLELVVFDYNARTLIGRSCHEVHAQWSEDPDREELPSELRGLIGKEVLIKIEAEGRDGIKYGRQYKAANISDDRNIIGRYREKWNDNQGTIEGPTEVLLIENTPVADSESTAKPTHGVSQDLINKFEESASNSNCKDKGKQVIDITRDSDETPPQKRKSPDVMPTSANSMPLKSVKIEK